MHWPRVASFRFAEDDAFVTAFVEPGVPLARVEDIYRRSVLPMAMQALGREALHASGILTASGVVAFAARSHSGKSTLAYALSRRGFPQWADDGVALDVSPGRVTSIPLPFQVRLRPESSRLFGFDDPCLRQFTPDLVVADTAAQPEPLAAICVIEGPGAPGPGAGAAAIARVAPAQAFQSVLIHAHEFDPHDTGRRRRMLQAYLELADTVPVYDLRVQQGREHLDAVLDAVVSTLGLRLPARVGEPTLRRREREAMTA